MKEFLDIFIFKPKKTERIILFSLKIIFALCYSIWIYKYYALTDLIEVLTNLDKLKIFLVKGLFIPFVFLFLLLYFIFFSISEILFVIVGWLFSKLLYIPFFIALNLLDIFISFILCFFTKKFVYKPFYKIKKFRLNNNGGGIAFRYMFYKVGILKTKHQKFREKDRLQKMRELKKILIMDKEKIFYKIYIRFIFAVLLYIFYFFNLKSILSTPFFDAFIYWFCLVLAILQLTFYILYTKFRTFYFMGIFSFRAMHEYDLAKQNEKKYGKQLSLPL